MAQPSDNVSKVITVCLDHTKSRDMMPLIYDKAKDKYICVTCGKHYNMFEGIQVMWTPELHERGIQAALSYSGKVEVHEIPGDAFTHPEPLTEEPKKPEPPKNFEQQLHDFIVHWKENNPMEDGNNHSKASLVLFNLYSEKASRGWTDYMIKQHFNIKTFFN